MFEPKTFAEKRLTLLESLVNQLIQNKLAEMGPGDDTARYQQLLDTWAFRSHTYRDEELVRVIGEQPVTEQTATREWIEGLLRANFGILQAFGTGQYNPDPTLPGNDVETYRLWLESLETADEVIRDTRDSSFYRDDVHAIGGLPGLMISTPTFLYVMVLVNRVTVQAISLEHLPAQWNWDTHPGHWRLETGRYLNTLSKTDFLVQFNIALKAMGREKMAIFAKDEATIALALSLGVAVDYLEAFAERDEAEQMESSVEQTGYPLINHQRMGWDDSESLDHGRTVRLADGRLLQEIPFRVGVSVNLKDATRMPYEIEAGVQKDEDQVSIEGVSAIVTQVEGQEQTQVTDIGLLPLEELSELSMRAHFDPETSVLVIESDRPEIVGVYLKGRRYS